MHTLLSKICVCVAGVGVAVTDSTTTLSVGAEITDIESEVTALAFCVATPRSEIAEGNTRRGPVRISPRQSDLRWDFSVCEVDNCPPLEVSGAENYKSFFS